MTAPDPAAEVLFTYRTSGVEQTLRASGDLNLKFSAFEVDAEKIEAGDWVGEIPEMGDLELKVRGLQNAQYRRLMAKLVDAVPRSKKQGNRVDPEEMERIVSSCLLSTVLLDWRGLEDENGPVPYSKDLASKFIKEPRFRRFREAVFYAAGVVGDADAEGEKADEGNSPST